MPDRSPAALAEELATRLPHTPVATQGLLLTALIKLRMHAPEDSGLEELVNTTFQEYSSNANPDIQQRAVEYLELSYMADNAVVRESVFAPMPEWVEQRPVFAVLAAQDSTGDVPAASTTGAVESEGDSGAKAPHHAADGGAADRADADAAQTDVVPMPARLLQNGHGDAAAAAAPRAAAPAVPPPPEGAMSVRVLAACRWVTRAWVRCVGHSCLPAGAVRHACARRRLRPRRPCRRAYATACLSAALWGASARRCSCVRHAAADDLSPLQRTS